jgi:hypothetical protein
MDMTAPPRRAWKAMASVLFARYPERWDEKADLGGGVF